MTLNVCALRRTNAILTAGTWFLIAGVVTYSLMTSTPFVAQYAAPGWEHSAPLLGLMADVAFVMALQADSVLARHGVTGLGPWPRVFRWVTGISTVFLNVWPSVAARDAVGVAVHLIAPALLLVVAEVAPVYRRAMADLIARAEQGTRVDTQAPVVDTARLEVDTPAVPPVSTPTPERPALEAAEQAREVDTLASTPAPQAAIPPMREVSDTPGDTREPEGDTRLSTADARRVIEDSWRRGLSVREAARLSTRSRSYAGRVYRALEDRYGPQPSPGQTTLDAA